MKVFISSYPDEEAEAVAERLRELHALSNRVHSLVENPFAAEIILVGSLGNGKDELHYIDEVLENDLIGRFSKKCFSVSYRDVPIVFNRGIYESGQRNGARGVLTLGRVRAGSYGVSGTFNPYAKAHCPSGMDYENKKYLFSFIGRDSSSIRRKLFCQKFNRDGIVIEDSSDFALWSSRDADNIDRRQKYYYGTLLHSKFSLCPRGIGTGSIRLFESMRCGVSPVIISDGWIPPKDRRWGDFSLTIPEKELDKLEEIVASHEGRYREMGMLARKVYEECFCENVYFNYIVKNCLDMMKMQLIPEAVYWKLWHVIACSLKVKRVALRSVSPN